MGLRPGRCYNDRDKNRPYTRIAVHVPRKNYVGAVPALKTRQFDMGNPGKDYKWVVDLVSTERKNVRDNSIESARMLVNRYLIKYVGKESFFMRIRIYPFHILRENKQAQGAGADRVSKGMSLAFGKPIGRAAQVRPGKVLMSVLVMDEKALEYAKKALQRAAAVLSCKVKVRVHNDVESVGTRSRKEKIIEERVAKAPSAEEKAEKKEEKVAEEKKESETEKKSETSKSE